MLPINAWMWRYAKPLVLDNESMPRKKLLKELRIGIGGIVFSIVSNDPQLRLKAETCYKEFVTNAIPDIVLSTRYGYPPDKNAEDKIFDSGGNWILSRNNGKLVFRFYSSSKSVSYKKVVLEPDFKFGNIYIRKYSKSSPTLPVAISPFQYPLDELLMINLLSLGRGVMIHACGIRNGAEGFLFPGTSGAGKTTMANLWNSKRGVAVLNDDRIIIREIDNRFWMYGTPWYGDARLGLQERAPLRKIFFIKHAKKNIAEKIAPLEAASRLITRCFPTFWNKKGMEFTLKFCVKLAQEVPCYELGFLPDKSVLDFIRS